MKRYIKDNKIKFRNEIVVHRNGMQTINPSEELILADGWVEHIPVPYEPTEKEILNREKEYKIEEILRHDSSPEVNGFYIKGQEMWLDKATRAGLMLRFQAEKAIGKVDTTLWYEGNKFELTIDAAMQMLYVVENYASACYDNTQRHLSVIDNLETKEEIDTYDYRSGYPEKLEF